MCGICGYFGEDEHLNAEILHAMNALIVRRGPDDEGYFHAEGIGLAMRRLSILDLAQGKQPIFNEDKTVCTVFNGEIYNYRELKKDLEDKGHCFHTHSDTEVIVHLYEEYGKNLVQHLRGMFAFAVWDIENKKLLIARDRLGIKPLFYSIVGANIIFGSEIKSVLVSELVSREMHYQAIDAYFTYTYIPAPLTIYKNIKKLEPGHLMLIDGSGIRIEQYWDLDFSLQDNSKSEQQWEQTFDAAIHDAVKSHLVSDVPVGAFLSGGVDSSLIVAMMAEPDGLAVETFTMGFNEKSGALLDERKYAKLMAADCNINYNELSVSPDFEDIVGNIVKAFDEPFADDSVVPSYYIAELTGKKVKVALSGLGGDELFAGYHRYFGLYLSRLYDFVPAFLHKYIIMPLVNRMPEPKNATDRINHLKRFLRYADMSAAKRYLGYISTLDASERRKLFLPEITQCINFQITDDIVLNKFNQCNADNMMDKMLYTDIKIYLPDDILTLSDRLSMWHSLELRVPLVDHELVELSAKLPSKYKINFFGMKRLLKKVASAWVPHKIIHHRKQGFESPMAGWLKNELYDYTNNLLSRSNIEEIGLFNYDFIKGKLDAHYSGKEKNNKIIFSLIMFVLWYQNYTHTNG